MVTKKTDDHRRPARVAARIQRELSGVLGRELDDPRVRGVVLSSVQVTDDLSLARVRFVLLGEDDAVRLKQAARRLKALTPALRAKLAPRLGMRRVPDLEFAFDSDRGEADRVEALLREVGEELRAPRPAEPDGDDGDDGDDGA